LILKEKHIKGRGKNAIGAAEKSKEKK